MFEKTISQNDLSALAHVAAADNSWQQSAYTSIVISGEETQGKVTLLEAVQHKGAEPTSQSHPDSDKVFYVIEGKMTFVVAGKKISAPAGTAVFIERGQEHTFTVETETANTLILLLPAPL